VSLRAALVAAAAAGLCAPLAAEVAHPERLRGLDARQLADTYTVGGFVPEYEPPPAGSYDLPVVSTVRDHALLDSDGRATTLFALKHDRLAVVAFVYTSCIEATGCPVSMAVLHGLDAALADDPQLKPAVTLIAVSFDPERDTPERMAVTRRSHAPRSDWHFATTAGPASLDPLLVDFGQPVAKLRFPDGEWSGLFRHVLKVFLLDRANRVRNIYSTGFLNVRLVLNDLRTLAHEH
jgi:cytochrome oxidase Cu insertion factor (SCO1/SenC/PrrC family)